MVFFLVFTFFAMKAKLLVNRTFFWSTYTKENFDTENSKIKACVGQYFCSASLTSPSVCSILLFFRTKFKISHSATLTKISFSTMNLVLSFLYAATCTCLQKRARILLGDRWSSFNLNFIQLKFMLFTVFTKNVSRGIL